MKTRLKKGDNVVVIAGKSLGKQGKIVRVLPKDGKVVVEGANLMKKRQKPRQQGKKGQVLEMASPITFSNVQLYCASCQKGVRLGVKITGNNKIRVCKSCGKEI